jgi:general secretion pathway protein I
MSSFRKGSSRKNHSLDRNYSRRKNSGFTLLEVLIALAILAISAAALLRQTQLQVKQQFELELKTYAMWVADDTLSALSAQPQWPPLGRNEQQVTFREQAWRITTDVQATADPLLRKVEVGVNLATDPDANHSLVGFTTFRGRY